MEERQKIKNRILQELQQFQETGYTDALNTPLFSLVNQRFAGSPLRAYFVCQMAGYLKQNQKWSIKKKRTSALFDTKLPFIFEIIISIQYLHNQVLDRKAGVITPNQISHNLLHANLLKDLLYAYIDNSLDAKTGQKVKHYVRRAFQIVDIGQLLEKEWNTLPHFDHSNALPDHVLPAELEAFVELDRVQPFLRHLKRAIPKNKWDYTALYLKRIYLTCGALFVLATKLLIELTGTRGQLADQAIQFSVCYGLMRQLINDNADLVPSQLGLTTRSKIAGDAFSDIKNGTITLPILLHLVKKEQCPAMRAALQIGHEEWDPSSEPKLYQELLESEALFQSIQFGKLLAAMCEQALVGKGPSRIALLETCKIAYWNKFLYPTIKTPAYRQFRKTSFYNHTKRLIRQLQATNTADTTIKRTSWVGQYLCVGRKIGTFFMRLHRKRII